MADLTRGDFALSNAGNEVENAARQLLEDFVRWRVRDHQGFVSPNGDDALRSWLADVDTYLTQVNR